MAIEVWAPAKINLCLHVTGQGDDGYHLLDSLVVFGPMADRVVIDESDTLTLAVTGPGAAGVPTDMSNLVLQAAALLAGGRGAAITLEKNLPTAAGIGGGSADAAAAVRGLVAHWRLAQNWAGGEMPADLAAGLLALGADVPMCIASIPVRVQGIGEEITPLTGLGQIPAVLVNPRLGVSTPAVFKALVRKDNPPLPDPLPGFDSPRALAGWLADQRNDLQPPAIALEPVIGDVLRALEATEGCLLARMSGSGATCFAIYPTMGAADAAARRLSSERPDWWVAGGLLGDQQAFAAPRPVS